MVEYTSFYRCIKVTHSIVEQLKAGYKNPGNENALTK